MVLYINMVNYQYVMRKEANAENTVNLKKLIGKRVLSLGGTVVGRITEIRLNPDNFEIEGVVVSTGFSAPIYIGKSYFEHLSNIAVILNTELSILIKGKKVVTLDGKVLGRVRQVNRKGITNEIEDIEVSSFWKKYLIPEDEIKQVGNSVLVNLKYDATKTYLSKTPKQDSNI